MAGLLQLTQNARRFTVPMSGNHNALIRRWSQQDLGISLHVSQYLPDLAGTFLHSSHIVIGSPSRCRTINESAPFLHAFVTECVALGTLLVLVRIPQRKRPCQLLTF